MDWIQVARDRDQRRALVDTAMNNQALEQLSDCRLLEKAQLRGISYSTRNLVDQYTSNRPKVILDHTLITIILGIKNVTVSL